MSSINAIMISAAATAAKSLQSCPTLCDPTDGSPPGPHPWDSLGKNTGVGCHFLILIIEVGHKWCWVSLHSSFGLGNVTLLLMVTAAYFLVSSREMIFRWSVLGSMFICIQLKSTVLIIPEFYHTEAHFLSTIIYVYTSSICLWLWDPTDSSVYKLLRK